MCLKTLGSTPYWAANLSIKVLICSDEISGRGGDVGLGVGIKVGVGLGVGVAVGVCVGVNDGVSVGVWIFSWLPKISDFCPSFKSAQELTGIAVINMPRKKYFHNILTLGRNYIKKRSHILFFTSIKYSFLGRAWYILKALLISPFWEEWQFIAATFVSQTSVMSTVLFIS